MKSISGHSDKIFHCFWSLGSILLTFYLLYKSEMLSVAKKFCVEWEAMFSFTVSSMILYDQFLKVRVCSSIALLERGDAFTQSLAGACLCQAEGMLLTHRSAQDRCTPGWE